jgi:hypothetical protein
MEGVAFGLDTLIIDLPGHEQLSFMIERGLARLAQPEPQSLRDLLQAPRLPAAGQAEQLWASDPARRFADFVEEVI